MNAMKTVEKASVFPAPRKMDKTVAGKETESQVDYNVADYYNSRQCTVHMKDKYEGTKNEKAAF